MRILLTAQDYIDADVADAGLSPRSVTGRIRVQLGNAVRWFAVSSQTPVEALIHDFCDFAHIDECEHCFLHGSVVVPYHAGETISEAFLEDGDLIRCIHDPGWDDYRLTLFSLGDQVRMAACRASSSAQETRTPGTSNGQCFLACGASQRAR